MRYARRYNELKIIKYKRKCFNPIHTIEVFVKRRVIYVYGSKFTNYAFYGVHDNSVFPVPFAILMIKWNLTVTRHDFVAILSITSQFIGFGHLAYYT